MKKIIIISFVCFFIIAFIVGKCNNDDSIDTTTIAQSDTINTDIPHIETTVVSSAVEIPSMPNSIQSQMLYRLAYCTSYNNETKCPN